MPQDMSFSLSHFGSAQLLEETASMSSSPDVLIIGAGLAGLCCGRSLDEAVSEAKLRVEAIALIPRVMQFALRLRF